ncbi:hypothetical protein FRC02_000606 [Tulasnella sp. 418]|nr:hypothetical protein FRC02_000606 [Tulasnella sp. 418]
MLEHYRTVYSLEEDASSCPFLRYDTSQWTHTVYAGFQMYENATVHPQDLILNPPASPPSATSSSPSPAPPLSPSPTPSPSPCPSPSPPPESVAYFYSSFHYSVDESDYESTVSDPDDAMEDPDFCPSDSDAVSTLLETVDTPEPDTPPVEFHGAPAEEPKDSRIVEVPNPYCNHIKGENCHHQPLYQCLCDCGCNKVYRRKGDAARHLNESSLPYKCDGCGMGHKRVDARLRHWKRYPECEELHSKLNSNDPRERKRLARKAKRERKEEARIREVEKRKIHYTAAVVARTQSRATSPRRKRKVKVSKKKGKQGSLRKRN